MFNVIVWYELIWSYMVSFDMTWYALSFIGTERVVSRHTLKTRWSWPPPRWSVVVFFVSFVALGSFEAILFFSIYCDMRLNDVDWTFWSWCPACRRRFFQEKIHSLKTYAFNKNTYSLKWRNTMISRILAIFWSISMRNRLIVTFRGKCSRHISFSTWACFV